MIGRLAREARAMGAKGSTYRLWHELEVRSGLARLRQPPREMPCPPSIPSHRQWWEQLGEDHWFHRLRAVARAAPEWMPTLLDVEALDELSARAEAARHGTIRCFSFWQAEFGHPVDWHRAQTGGRWPSQEHFSTVLRHGEYGDIKHTWELNRFPHVYDWARCYASAPDSRWPRAFAEQLAAWEQANPYRRGVNWASGQELAIRVMAWCFGVSVMGEDAAFGEADFARFVRLVYAHAVHIEENIAFARYAVPNNHLVGEALALLLVGSVFTSFPQAERWRKLGRRLLFVESRAQFHPDGGYCQASFNYQRLALHYLLWARHFASAPDESAWLQEVFSRSLEFLRAFVNVDGRLSNLGPNDGALLNPWTSCAFGDFRPLLSALEMATGPLTFGRGPWLEEVAWFFGRLPDVPSSTTHGYAHGLRVHEFSGVHALRRDDANFVVFRCGTPRTRAGHADQLHVDVWMDGVNVALDPGSYSYNSELSFHDHVMSAFAHNTVTVDGRDHRTRVRRFTFLDAPQAELVTRDRDALRLVGKHGAYAARGVRHRRTVEALGSDGWRVVDELEADGVHRYALHWLLADADATLEAMDGVYRVRLRVGARRFRVLLRASDASGRILNPRPPELMCGDGVEGWVSRHYGRRERACSLRWELAAHSLRFETQFLSD